MRRAFWNEFQKKDENCWLLYGDVGFGVIDTTHPRCINVGVAEQVMIGMAAGMASCGAKMYCYAIAPHFLRAWEFVRNLVVASNKDVTLVAIGADGDYAKLGSTHDISRKDLFTLCGGIGLPYSDPFNTFDLERLLSLPGPRLIHLRKGGF